MKLIIVGGGDLGSVVVDTVLRSGQFNVLGVVDPALAVGATVLGQKVLGNDEDLPVLVVRLRVEAAIVAVGDNHLRARIVRKIQARAPGIAFPNIIHPAAQLGLDARFGHGNVILAGAVVSTSARVGNFCLVDHHATVSHHVCLGDFVSFAPGVRTGGRGLIGDYGVVCLGANLAPGVKVGAHTVIGAGATVLRDLPDCVIAYGTPARVIRSRAVAPEFLQAPGPAEVHQ